MLGSGKWQCEGQAKVNDGVGWMPRSMSTSRLDQGQCHGWANVTVKVRSRSILGQVKVKLSRWRWSTWIVIC